MSGLDTSHILTGLVAAAITAVGFMAKRFITGAGDQERVARFASLTDIAAKMRQHGIPPAEVDAMERYVLKKRREDSLLASAEARIDEEAQAEGEGREPEGYWTQLAMNQRAYAALHTAEARLAEALLELEHYEDPEQLGQVQAAWEQFKDAQVKFAGSLYEGGSIRPLIEAGEALALTEQRLAWVLAETEERRRL